MGDETSFWEYDQPLEMVTSFRYLGIILTTMDHYWPSDLGNLQKARHILARLLRILRLEGTYEWKLGRLYLVIVQAVLIFGLGTWVVTTCIGRVLGGFHHRVSQIIMGNKPR